MSSPRRSESAAYYVVPREPAGRLERRTATRRSCSTSTPANCSSTSPSAPELPVPVDQAADFGRGSGTVRGVSSFPAAMWGFPRGVSAELSAGDHCRTGHRSARHRRPRSGGLEQSLATGCCGGVTAAANWCRMPRAARSGSPATTRRPRFASRADGRAHAGCGDSSLCRTRPRPRRRKLAAEIGRAAIVLDPQTGDILAMASRPRPDPNHPEQASADSLEEPPHRRHLASPVRLFKPFVVALGPKRRDARAGESDVLDCGKRRIPHGPPRPA